MATGKQRLGQGRQVHEARAPTLHLGLSHKEMQEMKEGKGSCSGNKSEPERSLEATSLECDDGCSRRVGGRGPW